MRENTYHIEADVAPFFEYRRYMKDGTYRCGVALRPDKGGTIHNYPERLLNSWPHTPLHYENGVSKNAVTRRSYKGVTRILKTVRREMEDAGIETAKQIPGFLIECMVWNVPNIRFNGDSWYAKVRAVLQNLWSNLKDDPSCKDWHEVNAIKFLFHTTQPWTRLQARAFVKDAWNYIGM